VSRPPTPAERARRFSESAIKTPANAVTFMRLLFAIPVLIWILDQRHPGRGSWGAFASWLVLWATDGLDGWLARRDGTTRSGAFLDPLADKILVCGGLVALATRGLLAWLPVLVIVGREVAVSAWRSFAARRGVSVPARRLGKWKANAQFFVVALVLFPPARYEHDLWNAVLGLAVALSVLSALDLWLAARQGPPAAPPDELPATDPALGRPEVRGASGAREV
jgi:CDP-diacylglycerol---glycerol-3-phosphate 3-phosphatidyltransferase